ncbi:NEDD8-activating enzyme E1 regulatory subunit [Spathaspora sp. JA1]|nr:NEDD8-activating enzyme E1 regulatory subunit [Spathaspora sp. JA1]
MVPAMDKDTRYDRQLRLWAASGQSRLENSHICLLNGTPTGSEILKNLILPGIGKFTIIDDRLVTKQDLSGNFFLQKKDLDTPIASAIQHNLKELNHEVEGSYIVKSIDQILANEPESFWDQFNVVIVSDYISHLKRLIDILWLHEIPLLIVNSVGFYGSLNLIAPEINVIETHDPSKLYDLRIDQPWPELQEFSDSFDLDCLDNTEHSHVPYIVIFIKALKQWKLQHNGQSPVTYYEKTMFRSLIESMSRNIQLETNFIEAYTSYHRAFQKTEIPNSIKPLLVASQERELTASSSIFWIYIAALHNFIIRNNGLLPLSGKLPDMFSDTNNYIKLQKIYHKKALQDQNLFTQEVYFILESLGRSKEGISKDSIISFCKNVQLLYVTTGSKYLSNDKLIEDLYQENENDGLGVYYGILTFNYFVDQFNRAPSLEDSEEFVNLFTDMFGQTKQLPGSILNIFKEILSHNTRNYHNLCSLMGGIASQEVLKLTTSQYIPLDNLFIFDGIKSTSERFKIEPVV